MDWNQIWSYILEDLNSKAITCDFLANVEALHEHLSNDGKTPDLLESAGFTRIGVLVLLEGILGTNSVC